MTMTYPVTHRADVTDNYHGTLVPDPYRWLEDDNSEATLAWVEEQNKVTRSYLSGIPFREAIRQRLETLWNYPKTGAPFREGDYYYYFKNSGLQHQPVLYRQQGLEGSPEVFIDPNRLWPDGATALNAITFSRDHRYAACLVSGAGSDWQQALVLDARTGQPLPDRLQWIKFSELAWKGNGFYYSRYPAPDEKDRLSGKNEHHQVYYHRIGTPQEEDELVYVDREHPLRNATLTVTEDERFLVLAVSEGTYGAEIWCRDLQDPHQQAFTLLIKGFDHEPSVIDNDGDRLLVLTNHQAPNYKVVRIDPRRPEKEHWDTIIPEQPYMLSRVDAAGGRLLAIYLKDASDRLYQYDYNGRLEREVALPGMGTVEGLRGRREDQVLFYSFTSFTTPGTVYKYDIATGHSLLFSKPEVPFNPDDYETRQVFFRSTDGVRVPIFLSYKKGMQQHGGNPLVLYGYGGFNVALKPSFNVSNFFFMEQGGIYAVVNLRGGSEYGEAWHRAGMLDNKQQVFDDCIKAAEYLVEQRYTSRSRIAVKGGSNGGLLVGACITQRPDLFRVALPAVGVLDMLRYHHFTIGWAWTVEYGSSDDPEQFSYLIRYSPLHNLRPAAYPATLITTADHDDRVVPAHSFKFAAALQAANTGPHPMLIRIDTQAGHGAGKPTSKQIEEAADVWAFTLYHLV